MGGTVLRASALLRHVAPSAPLARALWVSAGLLLLFGVLTALVAGPLRPVDVALNGERDLSGWRPVLQMVDRVGQRAVCLPILAAVALLASRRAGTFRPLLVAGLGVVAANLLVAVFKFGLERGAPLQGEPGFLEGGVMYPSGHTTNVVLVYGLAAYLWCRYAGASRRTRNLLVVTVAVLSVVMVMTSLTLRWHWFTDLVAGILVGAAVLRATIGVDRAVPRGTAAGIREPASAARRFSEDTALEHRLVRH